MMVWRLAPPVPAVRIGAAVSRQVWCAGSSESQQQQQQQQVDMAPCGCCGSVIDCSRLQMTANVLVCGLPVHVSHASAGPQPSTAQHMATHTVATCTLAVGSN